MTTLHIQLLGDFRLAYGNETVTEIHQTRLQSLLAYFLLHRDAPQPRQQIAFLFWPDSSESQARTNLRRELHYLRHRLPDADQFLQVDARSVQWRSDAPFTLDVATFEQMLQKATQSEKTGDAALMRSHLERAVEVYRGNLLPNCYDDWVLTEQERLERRFAWALERLLLLLEEKGDYSAAIRHAQRLVHHDPLHESTYRRLMRLHALSGDRAGALRVYQTCTAVFERELGVEPGKEIQDAYARLLNRDVPDVLRAQPVTPLRLASRLAGRQPEWQKLRSTWRETIRGKAQMLLIAGEAGIGKTRLAEELLDSVSQQGLVAARTRSYAAEGVLAYGPVIEWLRSYDIRLILDKLDDVWLIEVARLLPELLVERPDLPRPEPLSEPWQRQRLFEALARIVLADRKPRLLLFDDLQWCDPTTLEWLHYLLRFDPKAALLIVVTLRSEEVTPDHPVNALMRDLHNRGQLRQIMLGPLNEAETALLAGQVAEHELDAEVTAKLYDETEGNPLFVVETVRAGMWDQYLHDGERLDPPPPGSQRPNRTSLPLKINTVIESRLAQLSTPARELAGMAAIIGRNFTYQVLEEASNQDEDRLVRGLDELWQRRIIREQGADVYDFSHDKIRDIAYAGVSAARQRLLHRRVAQALETVYATDLGAVSGQIAAHYKQGGLPERAIPHYQRAGEEAIQLSAYAEAIGHLVQGIELLKALPYSPKHARQELTLQLALGVSLQTTRGWPAPEVGAAFERARKLCKEASDGDQENIWLLLRVLWGLQHFHVVRGELQTARELGEQHLELAQRIQDSAQLVAGHFMLAGPLTSMGEFALARKHWEQSIAQYAPHLHRALAYQLGSDPGVFCRAWAAHTLWSLGYPDQALTIGQEALELAQELSHPFSLVVALDYLAILHQLRRERSAVFERTEKATAICAEHGFAYYLAWARVLQGWALAEKEKINDGIAQMRQGLSALLATGARLREPYYLALLADASANAGQIEQGLTFLAEAQTAMTRNGEWWPQAELYRLQGAILDKNGSDTNKIEAAYRGAIEVARHQHAKSLELRAAMCLSRLWQSQGKHVEARQMLAKIYGWFSEGFDTLDLQAANALLDDLS